MESKGLFKYFQGDKYIWTIVLLLSGISILAIYTSSASLTRDKDVASWFYLLEQTKYLCLGWVIMFVTHRVKYIYFSSLSQLLWLLCVPLLLLLLFNTNTTDANEASRWLKFLGKTFQVSELAKLSVVLFLARFMAVKHYCIEEKDTFYKALFVPFLLAMLIFKDNFSTSAMVVVLGLFMMFIGGIRLKYIFRFVGVAFMGLSLFIALLFILPENNENKVLHRANVWKNRIVSYVTGDDPAQVIEGKIAIVNSRFIGKMPGNSAQKSVLPAAYNDFIYAIIIEEYGLLMGLFIPFLYVWLFLRGIRVAKKCTGYYSCYLALGVCFFVLLNAVINLGVVVGFLPVTGQNLPFISRGGSSLMVNFLAMGILLSISRTVEKNEIEKKSSL